MLCILIKLFSQNRRKMRKRKLYCLPNIVKHEAKWTIRIIYWRQVKHKVIFSTLILIQSVVVYSILYITLSMSHMMTIWANETKPKETYKFKYTSSSKRIFFCAKDSIILLQQREMLFSLLYSIGNSFYNQWINSVMKFDLWHQSNRFESYFR